MQSLASFLNMGGHGGFVWGAWGLAALVIGGLTWSSLRSLRAREAEIAALEAASPHRRPAGDGETS
ncbi:MAG: heme exporter protein CcmD [Alphaproteobacteria bacterium]